MCKWADRNGWIQALLNAHRKICIVSTVFQIHHMVYQPFKKKWKKKEQFHTSSERKGCCSSCFPQNDWKYLGLLCVFSHVTLGFFAVSILCWVLHTDLKWGKSKNVLTCYLFSSYNISLEALKNPGGIFFFLRCCTGCKSHHIASRSLQHHQ